MASKIWDAYTAYLAIHNTALPVLASAGAILDGWQPQIPTAKDFVIVGCDDPLNDQLTVAIDNGTQDLFEIGNFIRDERFTIASTYVAWTGDNDFAGCRSRAQASISAIESAVRPTSTYGTGDGMLNNTLNTIVGWCGIEINRVQQFQDEDGTAIHVLYTLSCYARV
jgi:hypothetical protein